MARQLMFSVDFTRCIDCKTCEMACNEHNGLKGMHRRQVVTFDDEMSMPLHISISCNHCTNPVCISICPENNFYKRRDGIVGHRAHNCKACLRCINACPFEAPKLNPQTNRADKCDFCVDRIDEGLKPVCVDNCITGALNIIEVDINDIDSYSFKMKEAPIATYTTPSIFVVKKQLGQNYFREG